MGPLYIISIAKTASKKIGALIRSMNFFLQGLLCIAIRPCMEYCCHVWAGSPSCYLELLDKLQSEYVGLLVIHLLLLWNPWLIVKMWPSQDFPVGITLVDFLQNWLNWFLFLFFKEGLIVILIDCMIFLSPFPDVTRMSMLIVSF